MEPQSISALIKYFGRRFSTELGINLDGNDPNEVFKWFVASVLYGARISETIVKNTYKQFERDGLLSPKKILEAGWNGLVTSLDAGGYVRYDFKTADKFLELVKNLIEQYEGNINNVHESAIDSLDLENRLKGLAKGIGEVTVNIFLRELRGIWSKADPLPQSLEILAARNLGLIKAHRGKAPERKKVLNDLRKIWSENAIKGYRFSDFEAALVRLGKDYCRRRLCERCVLKSYCVV